jgi:hypothetical protein
VRGGCGAAVSKLDPSGAKLVYSGVLSGTAWDEGDGLAVDSSGAVYVAGHQASPDLPTTDNGFDRTQNGDVDGFLAKVDPSGSQLVYSTFLGGSGWDGAMAMSIDSAGGAFLTGATTSADFPGSRARAGGGFDAFVTRIDTLAAASPGSDPGTFTLDVTPAARTVVRGDAVDYTAVVKQASGAPPATLSVEGLPEGATAALQAQTADTTTITIQTTASTPPGGYALTVVASGGGVQRTTTVQLNVHCCPRPA